MSQTPQSLRRVGPYLALAAATAMALLFPGTEPANRTLSLTTSAIVFAIGASGLGFLWGQAGQLNVAHAATVGVGAYVAAILAEQHDLSFAATLGLAIVAGGLASLVVSLASLRTAGSYFVILSFAVGQVAVTAAGQLESVTGGVSGIVVIPGDQHFLGFELADGAAFYRMALLCLFVSVAIILFLTRSRWGTTLRGIRENQDLALSLGSNVKLHRMLAFVVSGMFAGLAGQLYVYHLRFVQPVSFGFNLSIFFLLMVLLGGRTYVLGPTIGAFVYIFLPEFAFLSPIRSQMLLGLVFIGLVLVLPGGILSARSRVTRMFDRRGPAARVARAPASDDPMVDDTLDAARDFDVEPGEHDATIIDRGVRS